MRTLVPSSGSAALLASVLALGCVHRPAVPAAPPPSGWWIVETAEVSSEPSVETVHDLGVRGAAWRFTPAELQAVRPGYVVDRVPLELRQERDGAFRLQGAASGERPLSCRVARTEAELDVRCTSDEGRVTLRPALKEESASSEWALAQHGTAEAVCVRAASCWEKARPVFPYLEEYAPHGAADLRRCEKGLVVLANQFKAMRRVAPGECALVRPSLVDAAQGP